MNLKSERANKEKEGDKRTNRDRQMNFQNGFTDTVKSRQRKTKKGRETRRERE